MASFQARRAVKDEESEETRNRNRELNKAFLGFLGSKQDSARGCKAAEKTPQKALATSRETKVNTRRQRVDSEATTMAPGSSPSMAPSAPEFDFHVDEMALDDPESQVPSPFHKTRRLADASENEAITMCDTKPQMTSQQSGEIAHLVALARMAAHDIGGMQETPPATPRGKENVAPNTPRTPMPQKPAFRLPPTPCRARRPTGQPSLLRALQLGSVEQVLASLQHNPEAAGDLFWDHDFEPPLCAAVRLECSVDIVRLLLEHGADPHVKNVGGYTPARMLQELSSPVNSQPSPTPALVAPFVPDGLDAWPGLFDFLAPQRVEIAPWSLHAHELGVQEVVDAKDVNAMVWRHEVADLIKMW